MYVYILNSLVYRERYYVGLTNDPDRRLVEHNSGMTFHTRDHKPWRIVAKFWFENQKTAERFERYLKTGSGRAFALRHFA